jgi:hypothetical protein
VGESGQKWHFSYVARSDGELVQTGPQGLPKRFHGTILTQPLRTPQGNRTVISGEIRDAWAMAPMARRD